MTLGGRSTNSGGWNGGTITSVGTSLGTPMYMAPEQAAADPNTDHRADLYALGVVGYEMLVGAPPFYGRTPQALLVAQLTEAPKPISSRRYDVPPALADLLMRMMEKDPAKRPRTANEVARLQVLRISWDTRNKRWFHLDPPDVKEKLEPTDELHWTGLAQRWNHMCANTGPMQLFRGPAFRAAAGATR